MKRIVPNLAFFIVFLAALAGGASAQTTRPSGQESRPSVEIKTLKVAGGVHMLEGRGGNIGVFAGQDGVFMIDDQFAPVSAQIAAAIAKISEKPIRFLVNTHHHGDHTGGNENFGKSGAVIVAHENVRKHMTADQLERAMRAGREPEVLKTSLPVVTFKDSVTFHWNDDEVRVIHMDPAHTDGDSIIHFTKTDVIHTGDLFFNGTYPVIDTAHGGGIDGMIKAADQILALARETTRIIPGHGPLAGPKDLKSFRDMLAKVKNDVTALIDSGKSVDEVVALKPTKDLDEIWGRGFMKPDAFVKNVATMLSGPR